MKGGKTIVQPGKYTDIEVPGIKVVGKIELPVDKRKERRELDRAKKHVVTKKFYDGRTNGKGTKKLREDLYKAYNGRCCYCKCQVKLPISGGFGICSDDTATIEHVYPRTDIRRLLSKEVKLSCYRCNTDKGNADWMATSFIPRDEYEYAENWNLIQAAGLKLSRWQRFRYWWNKTVKKLTIYIKRETW